MFKSENRGLILLTIAEYSILVVLFIVFFMFVEPVSMPEQEQVVAAIEQTATDVQEKCEPVILVETVQEQTDENLEKTKGYITNLKHYNGYNIDFNYVYERDKYWTDYYGIYQPFHMALMYVESKFENGVVSCANCVGLCQTGQSAIDQFNTAMWKAGVDKFYTLEEVRWDIDKNIEVSCWYLSWLWDYKEPFTNNNRIYIQSYNYGRSGVKTAIEKDDFIYADAIIMYRDEISNL